MRARAKRTRSWIVFNMLVCVSTCAKATTSLIQEGMASFDSDVIWMLTEEGVISHSLFLGVSAHII
jgi:hypothetical protein